MGIYLLIRGEAMDVRTKIVKKYTTWCHERYVNDDYVCTTPVPCSSPDRPKTIDQWADTAFAWFRKTGFPLMEYYRGPVPRRVWLVMNPDGTRCTFWAEIRLYTK